MSKLAAIAIAFTLLGCAQTPTATQAPASPKATVNAQSPELTINGKTLVPTGEPCELPAALPDDELFNRILVVPIGASPEETERQVGKPPDQPLITYRNSPNLGTLIWTDNYYPKVVEMRMEFKDGKLTERFITIGENVGQDNEKLCSLRSRD